MNIQFVARCRKNARSKVFTVPKKEGELAKEGAFYRISMQEVAI